MGIDEAWKRFDSAQFLRETELRGPASKVNVMSNEDYDNVWQAKKLSRQYFKRFWTETFSRDAGFRSGITKFFTEKYADSPNEAISSVSEGLANSLIVYSQVACDPYFKAETADQIGEFRRFPVYKDIMSRDEFAIVRIASEILGIPESSTGITPESASDIYEAVLYDEKQSPWVFILEHIKKNLAGSHYTSEPEQEILNNVIDNDAAQQAFIMLIKELFLIWSTVLESLGWILTVVFPLMHEGAGKVPEDVLYKQLNDAHDIVRDLLDKDGREEKTKIEKEGEDEMMKSGETKRAFFVVHGGAMYFDN